MRKKKQINIQDATMLQTNYIDEVDNNPEFALVADPLNKYKMTEANKKFIEHYVNFKNVNTAAELAGISMDEAKQYFISYNTQNEIRRINRALYHRQFAAKLLSIDDIGGYLSSLLTGENIPLADQLETKDKLRVVDLILRLNEMKANGLSNPSDLTKADIAVQIKNLSLSTIQQLLSQSNNMKDKNEAIRQMDDGNLSIEEKAYLQSLPTQDLLQLIEDTNKGGQK